MIFQGAVTINMSKLNHLKSAQKINNIKIYGEYF